MKNEQITAEYDKIFSTILTIDNQLQLATVTNMITQFSKKWMQEGHDMTWSLKGALLMAMELKNY